MPSAMSRPPNEKASEMRKIHIPIFPGVAVPYWASGGQAAVACPCSWATVLLKPHLRLPCSPSFRYLILGFETDACNANRRPSRASRSHPDMDRRCGRTPSHLDRDHRAHCRVADLVGAPYAGASEIAGAGDRPAVRAHRGGWRRVRLEGPRRAGLAGELHLHAL